MKKKFESVMRRVSSIVRAMPPDHDSLKVAGIETWHRRWMAIYFEYIEPPANPGRGKRRHREEEAQLVFNEAALAALGLPSDIERHINAAFADSSPHVFRTIAEAIEAVNRAPEAQTKFARHCFHAMKAAEIVMAEREKLELVRGAGSLRAKVKKMVVDAMNGNHYLESDSPRWAEVWKKTGIPA